MNCTDCQNQFSDFIDDEISLKLARSFKSHLADCPACAKEWQVFQHTINTLHSVPTQKVPADFLLGINEKLDRQPFAKLRGWFSFMGQHKMTATTTLATLVVGVISAAVLQLSPLDSEQTVAQNDLNQANSTMLAMGVDRGHVNYYPGTPYLAPKTQTAPLPTPRPRVQFTPVKQSAPQSGHKNFLDSRGPPALSSTVQPHSSLAHYGTTSPDLVVTVHSRSTAYQHALIRQLTANHHWKTQISGNTLLVTLPCNQLGTFQHLFGPVNPHMNQNDLSRLSKSPSSLLTVAVAFH